VHADVRLLSLASLAAAWGNTFNLMSKLENQWIDIFRAGKFHAGTDKECQFTAQDVQQIVDNYDPAQYEAPAVIGHPKHDAPAFAWFSEVRRVGDKLQGKPRQVNAEFEKAVEDGRFKNRSAKVLQTAKGWTLRHVGFLGAQLPEVKGLAPIQFGGEDEKAIEIEFSEETGMTDAEQRTFNERMKAFFSGLFGGETAAKTFSETEVQDISTKAAAAAVNAAIAPLEARLKAQETQFSERETSIAGTEAKQRADAAILKVKAAGAWVPAFEKMGVPQLFAEMAGREVTIEFSEGGANAVAVKKSPLDIMVTFMESLKQIVPSGQIALPGASAAPRASQGINAGAFAVDGGSVRLHQAVLQFAEENKVGYIEASEAVIRKNPDLARLGGASAGAV
jgi:hypothetical protein